MLQFANYTLYVFAFLDLDSWLTPIALFLIVITGTGVRELSSALANPFGDDEVDFNSTRFINTLRSVASFLSHPSCLAKWHLPSMNPPVPPPSFGSRPALPPPYRTSHNV